MKLMIKTLAKKIPKLHTTDDIANPTVVAHYFNPLGNGDWYVIEGQEQDDGDWLFYGYVKSPIDPLFNEFGYFTLQELESITLPFNLGIERDLYWTECPVKEIM